MSSGELAVTDWRVAVIGAGQAGRSFTRHLLETGLRVTLEDVLPSNLRQAADEIEHAGLQGAQERLLMVSTVEDAVRDADLAIDFVPDELESKLEILSMMDRMAPPRTIFLTPTEALSISDLASCTYRPGKCFGLSGLSRERPFSGEGPVTLLHPEGVEVAALDEVERFLALLGLSFMARLDPFPTMLTGRSGNRHSI